jgi:hypothetical protein
VEHFAKLAIKKAKANKPNKNATSWGFYVGTIPLWESLYSNKVAVKADTKKAVAKPAVNKDLLS